MILSETERRLVRLKMLGQTDREIALITFRSPNTVRRHFANIYEKHRLHNNTEMFLKYAKEELDIDLKSLLQ